jgi:hypothetical protein
VLQATRGDVIPALIIGLYVVAGVVLYATYGCRRSRLMRAQYASEADLNASLQPAGDLI